MTPSEASIVSSPSNEANISPKHAPKPVKRSAAEMKGILDNVLKLFSSDTFKKDMAAVLNALLEATHKDDIQSEFICLFSSLNVLLMAGLCGQRYSYVYHQGVKLLKMFDKHEHIPKWLFEDYYERLTESYTDCKVVAIEKALQQRRWKD